MKTKLTEANGHDLYVKLDDISAMSVDVTPTMVIGEQPVTTTIIYIGATLRFRVKETPAEIDARERAAHDAGHVRACAETPPNSISKNATEKAKVGRWGERLRY